jgi:hypothetical protein
VTQQNIVVTVIPTQLTKNAIVIQLKIAVKEIHIQKIATVTVIQITGVVITIHTPII